MIIAFQKSLKQGARLYSDNKRQDPPINDLCKCELYPFTRNFHCNCLPFNLHTASNHIQRVPERMLAALVITSARRAGAASAISRWTCAQYGARDASAVDKSPCQKCHATDNTPFAHIHTTDWQSKYTKLNKCEQTITIRGKKHSINERGNSRHPSAHATTGYTEQVRGYTEPRSAAYTQPNRQSRIFRWCGVKSGVFVHRNSVCPSAVSVGLWMDGSKHETTAVNLRRILKIVYGRTVIKQWA